MLNEYVVNTNILTNIHLNGPMGDVLKDLDSFRRQIAVGELERLGFIRCDIYSLSNDATIVCFDGEMFLFINGLNIKTTDEQTLLAYYKHLKALGKMPYQVSGHQNYPMNTFWLFNGNRKFLSRRTTGCDRSIFNYTEKPKSLNQIDRIPLMGNNVEPISAKRDSDIWTEAQIEQWVKSHGLHLLNTNPVPTSAQPIPPQKDFRQKGFNFYVVEGAGKTQPYTSKNYRTKFFTNPQGQKGYEIADLANGGVLKLEGNNKENIAFMISELIKLKSLTLKGVSVIDCSCLEKDYPASDSGKDWYLDNVTVRGKFYLVGRVYLSDVTIIGGSHVDPYIIGKGKE